MPKGGDCTLSTKDTRREFEEIAARLAAEDPSLTRPVRMIPRRTVMIALALAGAVVWAGLSVLMVIWGAVGVVITCLAVVTAVGFGTAAHRRHRQNAAP